MLEYNTKHVLPGKNKTCRTLFLVLFVILGVSLALGYGFLIWHPGSYKSASKPPMGASTSAIFTATPSPTIFPPEETTPTVTQELEAQEPKVIPSNKDLRSFVNKMTLSDKIGQMMMVGFQGQGLSESPELYTLISSYSVGGIVLLERNAHDPQQIAQLITEAQNLTKQTRVGIPLFVSINHEGGVVVRITEGVTGFPGNMAIAASREHEYAYLAAALAAKELRAMGINMNLAPVLDVNDNPLNPIIGARSFGSSPEQVIKLGRETIKGLQQNGIVAVAKHFPGHGSVDIDSHVGLPVINKSVSELERVELPPFQMAVEEGVEVIMTAHIVVPAWEPTPHLPATLSSAILIDLLRERMRFKGIIMTDSLGMGAIVTGLGQGRAAVEAVKAGADIVLSTGLLEDQIAIHQALSTAVQNGKILQSQIDQSVVRILRVKFKYGLFEWEPAADLSIVGSDEHQKIADKMALAAITLLKDDANLVPLPEGTHRLLVLSPDKLPPADTEGKTMLGQGLHQQGFEVTELVFDPDAPLINRDAVYAEAMKAAPTHDVVIFGEWGLLNQYASGSDQWQERLVATLQKNGSPVIMIAWHDPASIIRLPQIQTFVTAYGTTAGQVRAVVHVLTGQASPQGHLPLEIVLPHEP